MAYYREGLHMVPEHMRSSVILWLERGEPHPLLFGSFIRALLTNDLMGAFAHADIDNRRAMFDWAVFLRNYAPIGSYGSVEVVDAWHALHHRTEGGDETEGDDETP